MNMVRRGGKVPECVAASLAGVSHRDQLFFAIDFLVQVNDPIGQAGFGGVAADAAENVADDGNALGWGRLNG